MTEEPSTCGQGLAGQAGLPTRMADVLNNVAAVLEHHMAALDLRDPASALEHEAYRALASRHRQAAEGLAGIAAQMAGSRDLPMGRHDEQVMMSNAAVQSFERLVRAEGDLLALLQDRVPWHRELLAQMQGSD